MEFVRARKATSVPSSASPSKHPQGKGSKENFPLETAAVFQEPQEVEMEGEEEEGEEELPPPPAVTGMMGSK